MRHDLANKAQWLKRLEEWSRKESNVLSEAQVRALELQKEEKEAHGEIETHHSDFLAAQDTYYVGYIKGQRKSRLVQLRELQRAKSEALSFPQFGGHAFKQQDNSL